MNAHLLVPILSRGTTLRTTLKLMISLPEVQHLHFHHFDKKTSRLIIWSGKRYKIQITSGKERKLLINNKQLFFILMREIRKVCELIISLRDNESPAPLHDILSLRTRNVT